MPPGGRRLRPNDRSLKHSGRRGVAWATDPQETPMAQKPDSAEDKKPINPLERQERSGIADGTDPSAEPIARSRHGSGVAADPQDGDRTEAAPARPRDGAETA
jgi:hypothetical protein